MRTADAHLLRAGVFAAFVPAMRLLHRKIVGLLRSQ